MNFSTSNRFNSFYDEDEDSGNAFKTMKSKKKEKTATTDDERFKFKSYFVEGKKEKKEEFNMEASAFPELVTNNNTVAKTTGEKATEKNNFLDMLNRRQEIKVEHLPVDTTYSHWVIVTRNKKTGKLTLTEPFNSQVVVTEEQIQKNESKLIVKVLTDLHMKRTKDYIDAWGKEEHYRTFYSSS